MANINASNVNITFDGLLCFDLDRDRKLCKIEVHTKAEGHIMKIIVKPDGGQAIRKVLSQEKLKELSPLHLFVSDIEGNPLSPSVSDSGSFDKILDLASEHFYKRKRAVKSEIYECDIWLQNGRIGAGELDTCHRVKQGLFQNLKFDWECRQEWEGFKRGVQTVDPEAIKDFPSTFARDVAVTITLAAGQSLHLVSLNKKLKPEDRVVFGPLATGSNYDISIEYADAILPTGLFDCIGFAHHCEALEPAPDPIFGIFKPSKFKDEDNQLNPITFTGCCECCRNDGSSSTNLLEEFQELVPLAAQPEILSSKSSNKAKK